MYKKAENKYDLILFELDSQICVHTIKGFAVFWYLRVVWMHSQRADCALSERIQSQAAGQMRML